MPVLNYRGFKNEVDQFAGVPDVYNPDSVAGKQSWLDPPTSNGEVFGSNITVYKKGRITRRAGVFLLVSDCFRSALANSATGNTDCVWCGVDMNASEKVTVAIFF